MIPAIPVVLGLIALVTTAVLFVRVVVAIRVSDRAVVTRHLQALHAREH
ncbi:hypothetical protein [Nonomuraea sediminis]|nr:hypothetical protein [Nonomuraea sediminis]